MSKYAMLDAKIIDLIQRFQGTAKFREICEHCSNESLEIVKDTDTEQFRVVDRRLQALRRAKKIQFEGQCWSIKRKLEI